MKGNILAGLGAWLVSFLLFAGICFGEQKLFWEGSGYDSLGASVGISGNYAVVGAPLANRTENDTGGAYVFFFDGTNWSAQSELVPSEIYSYDKFGTSVAISNGHAAVGAPLIGRDTGAVFVFENDGSQWQETQKILPDAPVDWSGFGRAVSMSGDRLIAGQKGSAFVYERDGDSFVQTAVFEATETDFSDHFGFSVAICADYAVVGGVNDGSSSDHPGIAKVYRRTDVGWVFDTNLPAHGAFVNQGFGYSVAISDRFAAIGAVRDSENGYKSGAVHVFENQGGEWTAFQKILPDDGGPWSAFGCSVDLDGDSIVVGSERDNYGGAAYLFQLEGGSFVQAGKFTLPGLDVNGGFGVSTAMDNGMIVVGSPLSRFDPDSSATGLAYAFSTDQPHNNPPFVNSQIFPQNLPENFQEFELVKLADVFADPDGNSLAFRVEDDGNVIATIENDALRLSPVENFVGIASVSVYADDGQLETAHSFEVHVCRSEECDSVLIDSGLDSLEEVQLAYSENDDSIYCAYSTRYRNEMRGKWVVNVSRQGIARELAIIDAGNPLSLAMDPISKQPNIVFFDEAGYLIRAEKKEQGWTATGQRAGRYSRPSLAFDPQDNLPAIAFNSTGDHNLHYGKWDGVRWSLSRISWSDACFESLKFDSISGERLIAFQTLGWTNHPSRLYCGGLVDGYPEDVGNGLDMEIDSSNTPHIIYGDSTNDLVKHAWREGSQWKLEFVDKFYDYSYPIQSLAIDGDDHLIASYTGYKGVKIAGYDGKKWHTRWLRKTDSDAGVGSCSAVAIDRDGCIYAAFIIDGMLWIEKAENPIGNSDPDAIYVDFEENDADPWRYSSENGQRAVISTSIVSEEAFNKDHSLALDFHLDAQDPDLAEGTAWFGFCGNLDRHTLYVWVKFIDDVAIGDPEHPNLVRIFVIDQNGKTQKISWNDRYAEIGDWVKIGRWTRLYFRPYTTATSGYETEEGFDATKIAAVGIQLSAGHGSTVPAEGRFYVDFAIVEREPGSGSDGLLDYNGDCRADLADLVIVNRILVGDSVDATWGRCSDRDVDGDGRIGFAEAASLLRRISEVE